MQLFYHIRPSSSVVLLTPSGRSAPVSARDLSQSYLKTSGRMTLAPSAYKPGTWLCSHNPIQLQLLLFYRWRSCIHWNKWFTRMNQRLIKNIVWHGERVWLWTIHVASKHSMILPIYKWDEWLPTWMSSRSSFLCFLMVSSSVSSVCVKSDDPKIQRRGLSFFLPEVSLDVKRLDQGRHL